MALTYTAVKRDKARGTMKLTCFQITFDNSYPSGGYAIDAEKMGMDSLISAMWTQDIDTFFDLPIDHANKKLKAAYTAIAAGAAGAELANGSAVLDGKKCLLLALGS